MVANVSHPTPDSITTIEDVISGRVKYKAFYNKISKDWLSSIQSYIAVNGNPEQIVALNIRTYTDSNDESSARADSLRNLYKPDADQALHSILENMRRQHGLLMCPSCGEAGAPGTLDHYLPKSKFPEFSILLLNLTPMCERCQGEKGTSYICLGGKRHYLHPYFDPLNTPIFWVSFTPPYANPAFQVELDSNLPIELKEVAKLHLTGIALEKRFKEFCSKKYIHLLKIAQKAREKEPRNPMIEGINLFIDMEEQKGINNWEAVFYRSVKRDTALLKYLEYEDLPRNL
jgi:5-methylcytosine-specific restriction endonuclease McrA